MIYFIHIFAPPPPKKKKKEEKQRDIIIIVCHGGEAVFPVHWVGEWVHQHQQSSILRRWKNTFYWWFSPVKRPNKFLLCESFWMGLRRWAGRCLKWCEHPCWKLWNVWKGTTGSGNNDNTNFLKLSLAISIFSKKSTQYLIDINILKKCWYIDDDNR